MKNNQYAAAILAITAAAFASQVTAENSNAVPEQASSSSKSRLDVGAELAQYWQQGVNPWSMSYNPLRGFTSTARRTDVTAAYVASRGEVRALSGEDSGSTYLAQASTPNVVGTTLAGQPDQRNLR